MHFNIETPPCAGGEKGITTTDRSEKLIVDTGLSFHTDEIIVRTLSITL